MRNIKFRFWHVEQQCYHNPRSYSVSGDGAILFADGHDCGDGVIAQQYTGLKDKNGKEIYEGDIVKSWGHYVGDNYYKQTTGDVMFEDGQFIIFNKKYNTPEIYDSESFELIGNIYENPELLETNN